MGRRYEDQCGTCNSFKDKRDCVSRFDTSYYEKGYCDYYRCYYYPDDSCNYYRGRGCYIATAICNLLNYGDDCGVLNVLRSFRNNVMQKDRKYDEMLCKYDIVGPQISIALEQDFRENQENEMIVSLFNYGIQSTATLIEEGKTDEDLSQYISMTKSLVEYYGITPENIVPENYDYTQGGHGKMKLITQPDA